nr:nucleolar and coiled-body phosphoprotein 1-like [Coffea arabica]
MKGTRSGRVRGRGRKQPSTERGNREPIPEPTPEPRVDPNAQVAAAIQRMTDLLAHVVEHQGQNPNPQPGNPDNNIEGEDRALQRFQKFSLPKFPGGPDPDVAERIRGGSTSAGRSFRLRDEDIEIVEPSTKAPKKKIVTRGGKVKQTAQSKRVSPTAEPSDEQMEEQNSEGNTVGGNEVPERAIQDDETDTRSSGKRKRTAKRKSTPQSKKKQPADPSDNQQNEGNIAENQQTPEPSTRKSPRTRTEAQNVGSSATQTSKRKRSGKDLKESRPEPTGPTTGTEAIPASSSQPKNKGKAPATVEAYEEDDEETEEEVDPEQFRLARRRPGSSKITI